MGHLAVAFLLLLLGLLAFVIWSARKRDFPSFEGHAVAVATAGQVLCVPRRYFNAHDATRFTALRNEDGSIRPLTPGRLELTSYLPHLEGHSDAQYANLVRNHWDKRSMPATWVRIEILGEDSARFLAEFDRTRADSYEPRADGTWKKKPDCVGRTAGAGAAMMVQQGPECVHWELRQVQTPSGAAWLACYPAPSSDRCDMATPQSVGGVPFLYDFHMSRLQDWAAIDKAVRERVASWIDAGRTVGPASTGASIRRPCG
jgi:hypothetical protein